MPTKTRVLVVSAGVAVALVVALVVVVVRGDVSPRVTASTGSDASALLDTSDRRVSWRTEGETVGAWVELTYPEPTTVDRVRLLGPGGSAEPPSGALLTFDGDAALLVTPDEAGDAVVEFPERTVSRVRMTVASVPDGAERVALAAFSVDGGAGDPPRRGVRHEVVAATSDDGGLPTTRLTDGMPADGDTGEEWVAAEEDEAPWASLSWDSPREIASVQVFGPSGDRRDGGEPLSGVLSFDDGSSIRVSSIATGDDEATTVAFAPRMATDVRLDLERPVGGGPVGLRELAVYDVGTTPPRWPRAGNGYASPAPDAGGCDAASDPVTEPVAGRLTLVCPSVGSALDGSATVVVAGEPGTRVEALAWTGISSIGANALAVVATATADAGGLAVLTADTRSLPRGPLTLRVQPVPTVSGDPLYVQLYNRGGRDLAVRSTAPSGMTLQWGEEFTGPLSVSADGTDADYAAIKPDASSSGQFGDAPFVDPANEVDALTTLEDEYLRIRTRPEGPRSSRDGTENIAGILASTDSDGAGFTAQYGYFEARVLGAPGAGTWPAFWMLNADSAVRVSETETEVDVVELYGHDTTSSCHTIHNWGSGEVAGPGPAPPRCLEPNGFADWALAWHTYGVRITPAGVDFTIDGQVVSTATGLTRSSEPFFLMIDLALGGGWPVDLSATGGVSDLFVDWVRVWT